MSRRLSRKEMKRDEFVDALKHGVDYASGHRRLLIWGGVAVVVVAVAWVGIFLLRQHREAGAATLLDRAVIAYGAPIQAANPKPEDPWEPSFADETARRTRAKELLEEVRSRYGGSVAAAIAGVYLGRIALADGDAQTARQLWQAFLDEQPHHLLSAEVRINLVSLDLQEGHAEEVATRLEEMLKQPEKPLPEDVILYQLATVREQLGRTGEALSAYQRIIDEFPHSPYGTLAQQKARALSGEEQAS
jgi:tetratricopeptide (TPR) repeat protein